MLKKNIDSVTRKCKIQNEMIDQRTEVIQKIETFGDGLNI